MIKTHFFCQFELEQYIKIINKKRTHMRNRSLTYSQLSVSSSRERNTMINFSTLQSQSRIVQKGQNLYQNASINYLSTYRKRKINAGLKLKKQKSFLPDIFCSFFNIKSNKEENMLTQSKISEGCLCNKTQEDKICQLILSWIEQHYFWKTDRQFYRIYQHYSSKKIQPNQQKYIKISLQRVLDILGLQFDKQQLDVIMEILINYYKHALYYQKFQRLLRYSDLYIWCCLGIMYHMGFNGSETTSQQKIFTFWALDIVMESFNDLSVSTLTKHSMRAMKSFQYYYSRWISIISSKGVNMKQIIFQWIQEMMFGYMGIQSIGFFLDCFRKAGWNYLIKMMLSYFDFRLVQIKKDQNFMNGTISKQDLIRLIIDSKQQWPMIFCSASSFSCQQ